MKPRIALAMAAIALCLPTAIAEERASPVGWTLFGDLGLGYLGLGDTDFSRVSDAGLGEIEESGLVASFSAGAGVVWRDLALLGVELTYSSGGVSWEHALGKNSSVPMYYNRLDLRAETEFLHPLLKGLYPFIGVGYGLIDDLTDENGDGFNEGDGSFHYFFGIDITKFGGIDARKRQGFVGLRLQVVHRPSFAYRKFYLYGSSVDSGAYGGVFDDPISASDLEFILGLRLCYMD